MSRRSVFLLTCVLGLLTACGPTSSDAAKYNDQLIEEQNKVANKGEAFFTALDGGVEDMEKAYGEFREQVASSLSATKEIKPFPEDKTFLPACVRALELQHSLCENEYKTIVALLSKPDDQISEEDTDEYGKLIADIDLRQKKAMNDLDNAQRDFAAKWNFIIDPTKTFSE
ncbi:MAG: hypothetical protein IT233_07925 [Bacteroidia bacterium]|nr:hypothetical protein [Bacteroidia bacterium]